MMSDAAGLILPGIMRALLSNVAANAVHVAARLNVDGTVEGCGVNPVTVSSLMGDREVRAAALVRPHLVPAFRELLEAAAHRGVDSFRVSARLGWREVQRLNRPPTTVEFWSVAIPNPAELFVMGESVHFGGAVSSMVKRLMK